MDSIRVILSLRRQRRAPSPITLTQLRYFVCHKVVATSFGRRAVCSLFDVSLLVVLLCFSYTYGGMYCLFVYAGLISPLWFFLIHGLVREVTSLAWIGAFD